MDEEAPTIFEKKVLITKSLHTCTIIHGDSREVLKEFKGKVNLIVTSPPYADARKRHYDSIAPKDFKSWFLTFHKPFFDALEENGNFVLNIKDKVVEGVRHRYVWNTIEALCENGWYSIEDYLWFKPNPMPGKWPNRLRDGWEYCFHLARKTRPYFNAEAVRQPIGDWAESRLKKLGNGDLTRHNSSNDSGFGRDLSKWVGKESVLPSNVLTLPLVGKNKGHPAVFPVELPMFFIKLMCPEGGLVLDPFAGSGTTGVAALQLHRNCLIIDNNAEYCIEAEKRIIEECGAEVLETSQSLSDFYSIPHKLVDQPRLFDRSKK